MSILINKDGQPIGFACGRQSQTGLFQSNINVEFKVEQNMLVVISPWHQDYLNAFKYAVPIKSRKWDLTRKVWFVAPEYAETVRDLIEVYFNRSLQIPEFKQSNEKFETIITAEYVANCGASTGVSSVFCNKGWNAQIPEKVLRAYFKNNSTFSDNSTYYAMLGIDEKATLEQIKSAYKRTARQWHPDVCKEPNAAEMFHQINSAYKLLTNPEQKTAYDAGLFFERMSKGRIAPKGSTQRNKFISYVPLLRCGHIRAIAHYEVGRIVVDEILAWQDITNENGQVMISQWEWQKDTFTTIWV